MIRLQCIRTIIVISVLSFLPAWVHAQGGLQFAAPRVLDQFTLDRDRYWGCAAGDINDDSLIDFIVTNGFNDRWSPGEVQVSLGRQGGGFNTLPPQFEDLRPARPLLEDLNSDGLLDLIVSLRPRYPAPEDHYTEFAVMMNIGGGVFSDAERYAIRGGVPVFLDFDGDGDLDIATSGDSTDLTTRVRLNDGQGGFSTSIDFDLQAAFDVYRVNMVFPIYSSGGEPDRLGIATEAWETFGNRVDVVRYDAVEDFVVVTTICDQDCNHLGRASTAFNRDMNGDGLLDILLYRNNSHFRVAIRRPDGLFEDIYNLDLLVPDSPPNTSIRLARFVDLDNNQQDELVFLSHRDHDYDLDGAWIHAFSSEESQQQDWVYSSSAEVGIDDTSNTIMYVDFDSDGDVDVLTLALRQVFLTENLASVPEPCLADMVPDRVLNFFDVSAFLVAYLDGDLAVDFNDDGELSFFDVTAFIAAFNAGCP